MDLKKGSKGAKVKALQTDLSRLGYLLVVDGDFGPKTQAAVRGFQKANSLKVDGIVSSITWGVINKMILALPKRIPEPTPVSPGPTPWMDWMLRNEGNTEISGSRANPFIIDLFQYTSLKNHALALSDETAWCAALGCAALRKNGYKDPNSASARSFEKVGNECLPEYGAIVTLPTTTGSLRHITFIYSMNKSAGTMVCIGGNQANTLKRSTYKISNIKACRWPVKL